MTACIRGGLLGLAVLAAAAAALPVGTADAQILDQFSSPDIRGFGVTPGVTVTSRRRDDYAPLNVRLGSFVLRPELVEIGGYDDNVLGTRHAQGSALEETRASLDLRSNWSRDSLSFGLSVDDTRYLDQPRQSTTNWSTTFGGSYDIGRDSVSLYYLHQNLNETPRDLDTPQLDETLAYRVDAIQLGYNVVFNRLSVRPELGITKYDFDNGQIAGQPFVQTYRNRTVYIPGVVLSYELAPRRSLIAVVRNAIADYDVAAFNGQFRNYNDTSVLVGLDYDEDGTWRYRALVGYDIRTFSSAAFKTISAPVAEVSVIYTPTGLTTLTGIASRRIEDSTDERTTGFTETAAKLTIDHEYLRNVLLQARGGVTIDEYSQNGGTQTLYTVGGKVDWLLNRNMRLSASYDFTARDRASAVTAQAPVVSQTQTVGGSYVENRFLLQLTLRL